LAHAHRLVRLDVNPEHPSPDGRGNFHLRLVGLDLKERRVLADDVAFLHQHPDDFGLGEALTEIGQDEGARHQNASVSRAAATTRPTSGTLARSRAKPTKGTS